VAYDVAAQKNICQACMTDLTFGLPVGVRDTFLRAALEKGKRFRLDSKGTLVSMVVVLNTIGGTLWNTARDIKFR
jgi:hypothetical protein